MKGFGLFVISVLLFLPVILSQANSARNCAEYSIVLHDRQAKFAKLAALRSAIIRSFQKTDKQNTASWQMAVQTSLAEEYGVVIAINGSKVTIISDELKSASEFYLR